ncbi:protein HAPLESS 2 isoform X2 [Magnolia sinica]|uniref:protein HAPLESS 2 isoform X2 n=1 Tax=Magnolia sinica TaxID=86752 RepID=UPI00265857A6|nr:protein HAPLESS 2 isoform X2 [Magnolia sinica]
MTRPRRQTLLIFFFVLCYLAPKSAVSVEILSKSKIEKCQKLSGSDRLDCSKKIVVNMAVPSESSGREASIVAELVEAEEEHTTRRMKTIRTPPVITVNKSAAYALYEITYIRDVSYKPVEHFVKTRKCEPDAGANVVKICERLRDANGHFIEHTKPICCPCGQWRRAPSSCGNFLSKLLKGKANTAHCLRFPGDWYHVFGIGRRSLGFSVRIEVKTGSKKSEVVVGPENRTVLSTDNFLRVNLIGDFVGYTSLPSFEEFYLVIPRQGGPGQPQNLGRNFSKWMLLERVRFTLDGFECNKIGVSYEAFNAQPNFCSSPLESCLQNQLWKFWDSDQNRISKKQMPQYVIEGRFERINQHPDAGTHSFSIGITEVLNTNLLIELSADDIEYVYQRSPGKIISVTTPTFEALTQFGTATITTKNTGQLEASYSLTFECSKGVNRMEITPSSSSTKTGINGFFESIESLWNNMWKGLIDFFTGKTCRSKCSGFFDFSCHIQYICLSWIALFGLLLAIFPTAAVLLWLLHQKGFFDPIHDWWEDRFEGSTQRSRVDPKHGKETRQPHMHHHHNQECRHHHYDAKNRRRTSHRKHDHHHHHHHHHHHAHKDRFKHGHTDGLIDEKLEPHMNKIEKLAIRGQPKKMRYK